MTGTSKRVFSALGRIALRSPARRRLAISLTLGALGLGILPTLSAVSQSQVPLATTLAASSGWLDRLNSWRGNTGVSNLTENSTWSAGDYNHALYMVRNDLVTHYETPGVPYYTAAGDTAARNSNIQVSSTTSTTDEQAIDWWMQAPFHAMGLMDPRLTQTGFGSYRQVKSGWQEGAAVDTLRGNSFSGGQYPVYFPGNGASEPLRTYGGGEYPDPLQACPGYSVPTGLPVFIQVGGNVATTAGPVHSFVGNGVPLEHCVIDSKSPSVGSGLVGRGGVIVVPRQPLQTGVRYVVTLTVNGTPYTWSFTVGPLLPLTPCTSVTGSLTPASQSVAGTSVTFSASAAGCPNPRYRFWIQPPGGAWGIAQDYSTTATYNWTLTGTGGLYHLEVDVRDQSSGASYDAVANFTHTITGSVTCLTAGLSPNVVSPNASGAQVIWTGSSTGCPNARYRFWELDPGSRWSMVQDYSPATTYTWHSPAAAGSYRFEVDVRDLSAPTAYDAVANSTYVLLQTVPSCTSAGLAATPTSSVATGASVTFTGSSATCPNPRYRFWVQSGGRWTIAQDYSAANTLTWTGTGLAGTYGIEVDVRDQVETVSYDTVKNLTYSVNGCSTVSLTASPVGTVVHSSTATFTATATCPGTPNYKFWVKAAGGSWTVMQPYSTSGSFAWVPSTPGTYSIEVDVRDQGGTDTYEKVFNTTYVVS